MKLGKTILCLLLVLILLAGCQIYDGPPNDPETPEPPAHSGVFTNEHGTMTFAGDGKSVTLELDETLAELIGLPAGTHEATYQFMANTPPHVYEYRYDMANELHISAAGQNVTLNVSLSHVTETQIPIHVVDQNGKLVDLLFVKDNSR